MLRVRTDFIVVHCAATPPSADIGAAEIDGWHKAKGWRGIGYHYVIRRNGEVEPGRPEGEHGAHEPAVNARSVAVCLVGGVRQVEDRDGKEDIDGPRWDFEPENNFTEEQFASLRRLLGELKARYSSAQILGHRDIPGVKKACPSFDVRAWWGR